MAAEKMDANSFASFISDSNTALSRTSNPYMNSNHNKLSSASSSTLISQNLIFLVKAV